MKYKKRYMLGFYPLIILEISWHERKYYSMNAMEILIEGGI